MHFQIFLIAIGSITFCSAQKAGSLVGILPNESKSPARQIHASQILNSINRPNIETLQISQTINEEPEKAALAAPQRSRADSLQSNSLFLSSSDEDSSHPSPEPYSFSYGFSDEENGSEVSREESQDASGNIIGFYLIRDIEGRSRRVDYTAGPDGFRAKIRSNEEGLANKDSADADFEVEEVPRERQNQIAQRFKSTTSDKASRVPILFSTNQKQSPIQENSSAALAGIDRAAGPAAASSALNAPFHQLQEENVNFEDRGFRLQNSHFKSSPLETIPSRHSQNDDRDQFINSKLKTQPLFPTINLKQTFSSSPSTNLASIPSTSSVGSTHSSFFQHQSNDVSLPSIEQSQENIVQQQSDE
ncbi:ionotropic GABA receptor beta subunit 1b [Sarcoptes scabiei]|nr:ionotropic GABA receptor beta subunit 1b [Sarcoptes scabiei]